ncbi:hypothetical protein HH1059_02480 [Halorhodospira halochloris]|uniref:HDOD domain-containing protein n=1 Tax=Halorhodospira halochloris TaxID=1052 RepID=A0A0X8X7B6_HALHR|nr:HDOD domain-containing protein [Halorhodospira halochloris]MBK1652280.1 histidine kinase [Halorhodospira halochloris]BAU56924.1 hypothetical protein HH1059_02480 [Halorhodospira halochloris]
MSDKNAQKTLETQLSSGQILPALPYVAHDIIVSTSSNDVDISHVAETLSREPGLSARVVAVANYAFFTRRETVYSLESAIMRIGMNRVRVLATSLILNKLFNTKNCPEFHLQRYWLDAISTAFAAARLAPHYCPGYSTDAAYLGGMLHSIGLPLLVHTFPSILNQALAEHNQKPETSLSHLIYQALGSDYSDAGGILLREWGLPEPIIAVAANSHSPGYAGPHAELVAVVHFTHEWLKNGYDASQIDTTLHPDQALLQRIAKSCAAEEESLAAFAELLAQSDD